MAMAVPVTKDGFEILAVGQRVSDFNSGHPLETFEAVGEPSNGSALADTTDEAIAQAAAEVVGEVLKINAPTAK